VQVATFTVTQILLGTVGRAAINWR